MTYGWSILIIAVVLGALSFLGVFNPVTFAPKAAPGSCQIVKNSELGISNLVGSCNNQVPQYVASLNGSSSDIVITNPNSLSSDNLTVTAWIDPTAASTGGGIAGIVSYGSGCSSNTAALIMWNGYLYKDGCGDNYNSMLKPSANVWEFVAMVVNSTDTRLYLNSAYNTSNTAGTPYISSLEINIGCDIEPLSGCQSGDMFGGYVADVQIYNTSLTNSSVQELYREGLGGLPINLQKLVNWYPLNGNANDYSGNQNNGAQTKVVYTSSWYGGYTQP